MVTFLNAIALAAAAVGALVLLLYFFGSWR
jgi:hypothetical protein